MFSLFHSWIVFVMIHIGFLFKKQKNSKELKKLWKNCKFTVIVESENFFLMVKKYFWFRFCSLKILEDVIQPCGVLRNAAGLCRENFNRDKAGKTVTGMKVFEIVKWNLSYIIHHWKHLVECYFPHFDFPLNFWISSKISFDLKTREYK